MLLHTIYIDLYFCLKVTNSYTSLHLVRFVAIAFNLVEHLLTFFASLPTVRRQLNTNLPRIRYHWCSIRSPTSWCLLIILAECGQFRLLFAAGLCWIVSKICCFQKLHKILLQHLFVKTFSLLTTSAIIFHVSHPYRSTDLTHAL